MKVFVSLFHKRKSASSTLQSKQRFTTERMQPCPSACTKLVKKSLPFGYACILAFPSDGNQIPRVSRKQGWLRFIHNLKKWLRTVEQSNTTVRGQPASSIQKVISRGRCGWMDGRMRRGRGGLQSCTPRCRSIRLSLTHSRTTTYNESPASHHRMKKRSLFCSLETGFSSLRAAAALSLLSPLKSGATIIIWGYHSCTACRGLVVCFLAALCHVTSLKGV